MKNLKVFIIAAMLGLSVGLIPQAGLAHDASVGVGFFLGIPFPVIEIGGPGPYYYPQGYGYGPYYRSGGHYSGYYHGGGRYQDYGHRGYRNGNYGRGGYGHGNYGRGGYGHGNYGHGGNGRGRR